MKRLLWTLFVWAALLDVTSFADKNVLPYDTPLSEITFVSFDVETTGLGPTTERILEFGAVKFRDGKIIEEKSWLINPQQRIHFAARRVHGISSKSLKDKKVFAEVYPEISEFIGDSILLAHNAAFDVNFYSAEIKRLEQPIPPNIAIDTLKLFRTWFPDAPGYNLANLADHLGVTGDGFHRGLADARYVVEIFFIGMKRPQYPETLGDLIEQSGGFMPLH